MAFIPRLPNFNLTAQYYPAGTWAGGAPPTAETPAQLYVNSMEFIEALSFSEEGTAATRILRVPSDFPFTTGLYDVFTVESDTDRPFSVIDWEFIHQGFPNEYVGIWIVPYLGIG